MYEKSLDLSQIEFLLETRMVGTRTTMKEKYYEKTNTAVHTVGKETNRE